MKSRLILIFLSLVWLALGLSCQKNYSVSPVAGTVGSPTATPTATTPPGLIWTQATPTPTFPIRYWHSSVVFNNAMWVIAGANTAPLNDVWSSTDGAHWNQTTAAAFSSARAGQSSVVYGTPASMWSIAGAGTSGPFNDVWASTNGTTWNQVLPVGPASSSQFTPRFIHSSVVYNNKMWVIGGFDTGLENDVWSSSNGVTWTQVLPTNFSGSATQFTPRYGMGAVVYNGLMWVIGGRDASGYENDVWSSPDGVTWTQVLATSAPGLTHFSGRADHTCVVYNGAMWVLAGTTNGTSLLNDVWSSTNGSIWTQVSTGAAFTAREDHSSVVFNNSMWIIAGIGLGGVSLSDAWHSP